MAKVSTGRFIGSVSEAWPRVLAEYPANLAANTEPDRPTDDYRIVAVKKGDCVRGYRIRHDYGDTCRFRGAMMYTLEAARELRDFFKRNDSKAGTSMEVIE